MLIIVIFYSVACDSIAAAQHRASSSICKCAIDDDDDDDDERLLFFPFSVFLLVRSQQSFLVLFFSLVFFLLNFFFIFYFFALPLRVWMCATRNDFISHLTCGAHPANERPPSTPASSRILFFALFAILFVSLHPLAFDHILDFNCEDFRFQLMTAKFWNSIFWGGILLSLFSKWLHPFILFFFSLSLSFGILLDIV